MMRAKIYDRWVGRTALYLRALTRTAVLRRENRTQREAVEDTGLHLLLQFMHHPVGDKEHEPMWSPAKYQAVGDVDIYSMWTTRTLFTDELHEAASACEERDRQLEEGIDLDADHCPELVRESFHSHIVEKKACEWLHSTPQIEVSLRATDAQIKEGFAEWLAAKRAEMKAHKSRINPRRRKFSSADYRRWHKNRVLAFIDLELFAHHLELSLTDEFLGDTLFPTLHIGRSERVRKTVRPLAKWLMTPAIIDALEWQSGSDYAKAKRPEE